MTSLNVTMFVFDGKEACSAGLGTVHFAEQLRTQTTLVAQLRCRSADNAKELHAKDMSLQTALEEVEARSELSFC